jgi:hypothetical protein
LRSLEGQRRHGEQIGNGTRAFGGAERALRAHGLSTGPCQRAQRPFGLPAIFRHPNGKVIEVDKKNKKAEVLVPVDVAREVIKVGYVSAQAQLCDMLEEQAQNYDALMAREIVKKTWSEQQLLYISTLHRMTIHMAAGKLRVVEKGPDEIQVFQEAIEPSKDSCPDDKRKRVKETITAYAAGAPVIPRVAGSPPPATGAAAPVQPAAAKEKPAAKEKK